MQSRRLLIAATVAGCALLLTACGDTAGKKIAGQLSGHSIAPKVAPPSATLVSQGEIAALPLSSPRRAFLSMWSDLQWQSWTDALSYYHAGLVRLIGEVDLLQALKFNAATYRISKPKFEGESTHNGRITIRYIPSGSSVKPLPSSITWERVDGRWIIYYDPSLDNTLRSWAQTEAQQTIDPAAPTPSPRAVAAGIHASEIQDRYVVAQLAKNGG